MVSTRFVIFNTVSRNMVQHKHTVSAEMQLLLLCTSIDAVDQQFEHFLTLHFLCHTVLHEMYSTEQHNQIQFEHFFDKITFCKKQEFVLHAPFTNKDINVWIKIKQTNKKSAYFLLVKSYNCGVHTWSVIGS